MNSFEEFRDLIRSAGLQPPDVIEADGKLRRFASNGKRGDDAGWYVLHGDGIPAGSFGDWRTGISQSWRANIGRSLTPAEESAHHARVDAMRREREAEELRRKAEAAITAAAIWNAAQPARDDHPYLTHKGVKAHGARLHDGALVIPVRDGVNTHSLQFINADGQKRFLTGGRVAGCYFAIGNPDGAAALCIAEGYATGATIHEATNYPVAVAFNAGNLEPVARSLRITFPTVNLILCADDDVATEGNPGLTKARAAALAVGAKVAIPNFGADRPEGATDFNDMTKHCGLEAVARLIATANFTSDYREPPSEVKWNREINAGVLQRAAKDAEGTVLKYLPLLGQSGFVVKGWSHIVAGYPKSGKSELIVRIISEWPDEPVLYITEEPETVWKARLRHIQAPFDHVTLCFGLGLTRGDLLQRVRESRQAVVIIDTLRNLLGLRDESDNSEVARALIPFIAACRNTNSTLIGVHHDRKGGGEHGEGIAGGHAFLGAVDIALELRRDGKDDTRRRVLRGWGRVNEIPTLLYELNDDNTMVALGSPGQVSLAAVQARARDILTDEWLETTEILEQFDQPKPSRDQLTKALCAFCDSGEAERDPPISDGKAQGKRHKWRRLNLTSDEPLYRSELKFESERSTGLVTWTQDI
jgi:phage/plasmid primase-like uncharacterized protein